MTMSRRRTALAGGSSDPLPSNPVRSDRVIGVDGHAILRVAAWPSASSLGRERENAWRRAPHVGSAPRTVTTDAFEKLLEARANKQRATQRPSATARTARAKMGARSAPVRRDVGWGIRA